MRNVTRLLSEFDIAGPPASTRFDGVTTTENKIRASARAIPPCIIFVRNSDHTSKQPNCEIHVTDGSTILVYRYYKLVV